VALPVGRAKTFSYHGADLQFIQAASTSNLRLAVGIPNAELEALAQRTDPGVDHRDPTLCQEHRVALRGK
jgi:hypothetical protein